MQTNGSAVARSILMAIALAVALVVETSAQNPASEVPEYGIRATIPDGLPVCWAEVLSHVHGVGTVLVGSDCENKNDGPAFNLWADWNTTSYETPLDSLVHHPFCAGSAPTWAGSEWTDAIGSLKTAMCRNDRPNGRVEIAFVAQAGKWPDDPGNVPFVDYDVNFVTTQERLTADLVVLKKFLRSIAISPPEQ